MNQQALSSFIWSVADLLRGDYKQSDYGKVILPLTVLRRLDCILAPTKEAVLAEKVTKEAMGMNPAPFLAEGFASVLQHLANRSEETDGRSGQYRHQPVQLCARLL